MAVRLPLPEEPSATEGADGVVVVFHWNWDPCAYAVAVPLPPELSGPDSRPAGIWTGRPVDSVQGWVDEVAGWLMEELDTGLVRRSARAQIGDVAFLDAEQADGVRLRGHHIGAVSVGSDTTNGSHLAEAGLNVGKARRLLEEGRLSTWLQASSGGGRAVAFVGHAVVSWPSSGVQEYDGARSAHLEVVEVVLGAPAGLAAALAWHAVRNAVEAGASIIVTSIDGAGLDELGFRWRPDGRRSVSAAEVSRPDL